MPLTPAEVHNVAFKKPPIGKRGYDEEEVDAFLDLVEAELTRLLEENNALKGGAAPAGYVAPSAEVAAAGTADLAASREENTRLQSQISELEKTLNQGSDESRQQLVHAQHQLAASEQTLAETRQQLDEAQQAAAKALETARAAQQPPQTAVGPVDAGSEQAVRAVQMLTLAQQTADQHISQSKAEASRVVSEARQAADAELSDAKARAASELSDAQSRAEQLERESTAKATQTVQDAEQHAGRITGQLVHQKASLERRVEQLRSFEHEYRTRLKSYLESQLRDLDAGGGSEPAVSLSKDEPAPQSEPPRD
jgi:DivIVA domain-containing protein